MHPGIQGLAHTHTCMHSHRHACPHTGMHAHTHKHSHVPAYKHIHGPMHTYAHAHTCTHTSQTKPSPLLSIYSTTAHHQLSRLPFSHSYLFGVSVYVTCTCVCPCLSAQTSILLFHHVSLRDQIQVTRLGRKCLRQLNQLTSPIKT